MFYRPKQIKCLLRIIVIVFILFFIILFLGCVIPQRYILGVMGLLGVCNAYTMRVCLNLAITQMVNRTKSEEHFDPDACPDDVLIGNKTVVQNPVSMFHNF